MHVLDIAKQETEMVFVAMRMGQQSWMDSWNNFHFNFEN